MGILRKRWLKRTCIATSKPSILGISISSKIRSGVSSCKISMASIPSLATTAVIPWRSKKREVTLRTVTESSTTNTIGCWRCTLLLSPFTLVAGWASLIAGALRNKAIKSSIIITEPSPMMVAAEIPATCDSCLPSGFTTTSIRDPAIWSTCSASFCPLRFLIIITGKLELLLITNSLNLLPVKISLR